MDFGCGKPNSIVTVNLQKNKNGLIELKMEQNLLIFNLIWTQMKIGVQHLTPAAPEGTQAASRTQAALETPKRNVNGRESLLIIKSFQKPLHKNCWLTTKNQVRSMLKSTMNNQPEMTKRLNMMRNRSSKKWLKEKTPSLR